MPNRVMVKPHNELVSIRPIRKNGKGHHMGSCMIENVTVKSDGLEGDLLNEWTESRELDESVAKHLVKVEHTDKGFVLSDDFEQWISELDAWIESESDKPEPEFPSALTGETFKAAYVCGSEFYVSRGKR